MHTGEITKETKFVITVLWMNSTLIHAMEWDKYISWLVSAYCKGNCRVCLKKSPYKNDLPLTFSKSACSTSIKIFSHILTYCRLSKWYINRYFSIKILWSDWCYRWLRFRVRTRAEGTCWKQLPAERGNAQRQWEALMNKINTLSCTARGSKSCRVLSMKRRCQLGQIT